MSTEGTFAAWQPRYAELGVATFPVVGKRPAVKGYLRVGISASQRFVSRFGGAPAFGLALERAGITVVDVDTPDERVLADALAENGPTPLIVRSGSGNFQAWYKRAGERRKIRPDPKRPIDILGGGFVVAPPSKGAKGSYQILEGRLEDIANLPTRQKMEAANSEAVVECTPRSECVPLGTRNDTLWRRCMYQAHFCDDFDAMLDVARTESANMMPPLGDEEVLKTAKSAWSYTERGENWFRRGRRVVSSHDEVDGLMVEHPDAFLLLTLLRRSHWGRDFTIANDASERMPGGGWARKRLASARKRLEQEGLIEIVHPPSSFHGPAVYRLKGGR